MHLTAEPGQTHWRVRGPGGAPLEYDAILTDFRPNEVIAWKTTEGSAVQHAGFVRFERTGDMSTRLTVRMSYNPPGGAIGHAAAALVGGDLKRTLDEDFVRLKTLLETGNPPHDAGDRFAGWREVRT